jgi:hypothetical protein
MSKPEITMSEALASEAKEREITERLSVYFGLTHQPIRPQWGPSPRKPGPHADFDPFTSLDDAHLLLVECDKRGLMFKVATKIFHPIEADFCPDKYDVIAVTLLATSKQITTAIDAVVQNLPREQADA